MTIRDYQEIFKDAVRQKKILSSENDGIVTHLHLYALRPLNDGFQVISNKEVFNIVDNQTGDYSGTISTFQIFDVAFLGTKGLDGFKISNLELPKIDYLHRNDGERTDAIDNWFTTFDE